jgi:primase-polymerase (primpol)-like protein
MTLSTTMAPLAQNQRWLNWVLEPNPLNLAKPRKVPISPRTGYKCTPNDPANWCSYDEAHAAALQRGHGLAYQFHEGDGYWFFDLDNCLQPDGQWSPLAQYLMSMWEGHAAIEVSQSGNGLHIFGWASVIPVHGCRNIPLGLELYHTDRFVAFTDYMSVGAIDADTSATLAQLVEEYFPRPARAGTWWIGPIPATIPRTRTA